MRDGAPVTSQPGQHGSGRGTAPTRAVRKSLAQTHPAIAAYWHPIKNGTLTPSDVTAKQRKLVWWKWPDGHEDTMSVDDAAAQELRGGPWACVPCRHVNIQSVRYPDGTLIAEIPELVAAWIDEEPYDGKTLGDFSFHYLKLQCPQGHQPKLHPSTFLQGCPHCRGAATKVSSPTVASAHPEMASQWHPTRNTRRADEAPERSKRAVWWVADCCGHEWQMSPRDRYRPPRREDDAPGGQLAYRCPRCQTILGSLGFTDPDLAATWHPDNGLTPFQVRPFAGYVALWQCPVEPAHQWRAAVSARSSGTGCPECSTAGTSRPEKELTAALCELGADAAPGKVARTIEGAAWRVDALATVGGRRLVVEFDGSYWHRDKAALDEAKTRDLLASGHHVVRVRCHPLPPLDVDHPRLLQLDFQEGRHDVMVTAAAIWRWLG